MAGRTRAPATRRGSSRHEAGGRRLPARRRRRSPRMPASSPSRPTSSSASGSRAVTVVGIAEAAGMTHANVYRYFPSKAALIDAVAARWLKSLEATHRRHRRCARSGGRQARAPDPGLGAGPPRPPRREPPPVRRLLRRRPRPPGPWSASTGRACASSSSGCSTRASPPAKFDPRDRDRALAFIGGRGLPVRQSRSPSGSTRTSRRTSSTSASPP